MKKFRFSLATVLAYKQQVLDALQAEHGAILADINRQTELISMLNESYKSYSDEYQRKTSQGIMITDALSYQAGLRAREREILEENNILLDLKKKEEAKRSEVVQAKQDTSSLEMLQEKKLEDYNHAVAKSEEQYIEEFVSSRWAQSHG